jgi:hypothetical protein
MAAISRAWRAPTRRRLPYALCVGVAHGRDIARMARSYKETITVCASCRSGPCPRPNLIPHRPFPNNTTSTVCTRMFRSSKKLRCFT